MAIQNYMLATLVYLKSRMRYLTGIKQILLLVAFCTIGTTSNEIQAQTGSEAWFDMLHDDMRTVVGDEEMDGPLLSRALSISVDEERKSVYILNRFDQDVRVLIHNLETETTCDFGSFGPGPGDFRSPLQVLFREGMLVVVESLGRISVFDVPEDGSCDEVEFATSYRIADLRIADACFVGDARNTMAAFDGRFTEREGFIHLFDASFAYKKSIGSLPPSYYEETDLYPKDAGSVYCLDNERIAATYEANHNILSVFSRTGETVQTISFDEYPAPTVNTRMMDGQQWYSWDMKDTYRIHQVTHIEGDTYLVQLRAYDSGGPTEEREGVISYRVDIETGSKTRLGVGDREFAYYTDDLWIGIQQPYPMPRVFIHGR